MDQNTDLILVKAGQAANWEDEEKATNDLEVLREEYRRRLYSSQGQERARQSVNGEPARKKGG
jgi:hypothetical protein